MWLFSFARNNLLIDKQEILVKLTRHAIAWLGSDPTAGI